jgi:hypothetical protein
MADKKLNILQQARLFNIYREVLHYIRQLSKKYEDDQLIASTLLSQGLRLYRGILDDKSFNELLDAVIRDAKLIKPIEKDNEKSIN